MKRYMWNMMARRAGTSWEISNTDVRSLLEEAIRHKADAVSLFRGREIKGKQITVEDIQRIYKGASK